MADAWLTPACVAPWAGEKLKRSAEQRSGVTQRLLPTVLNVQLLESASGAAAAQLFAQPLPSGAARAAAAHSQPSQPKHGAQEYQSEPQAPMGLDKLLSILTARERGEDGPAAASKQPSNGRMAADWLLGSAEESRDTAAEPSEPGYLEELVRLTSPMKEAAQGAYCPPEASCREDEHQLEMGVGSLCVVHTHHASCVVTAFARARLPWLANFQTMCAGLVHEGMRLLNTA